MTVYPKTKLGRVLFDGETEDDVIAAIKADEIFGFVVADVITDDDVIQKWEQDGFLFPPCIQRKQLGMEHLSPFMAQRYAEQNREPQSTVVQTYNAQGVLLMTEMVKLYLERGIKVTNIQKVMQYQPGRALSPFVEKVTSMRIAAKVENDEAKGTTAKLMGNSGKFNLYCIGYTVISYSRVRENGREPSEIHHNQGGDYDGAAEAVGGEANISK